MNAKIDAAVTEEEAAEKVEASMTALDVLLGASPARQKEEIVIRKREGLPADLVLEVGSLTDREFKALSDEAEVPSGNRASRRGGREVTSDSNLFLRLVVAAGTTNPNFNSAQVTSAHGVPLGHQVVQKILLPGEIARLAEIIMDLSGFSENTVEFAKN